MNSYTLDKKCGFQSNFLFSLAFLPFCFPEENAESNSLFVSDGVCLGRVNASPSKTCERRPARHQPVLLCYGEDAHGHQHALSQISEHLLLRQAELYYGKVALVVCLEMSNVCVWLKLVFAGVRDAQREARGTKCVPADALRRMATKRQRHTRGQSVTKGASEIVGQDRVRLRYIGHTNARTTTTISSRRPRTTDTARPSPPPSAQKRL